MPDTDALQLRGDAPTDTALDRNSFGLLGASVHDNRRRIVELAEARSLVVDPDACAKARSELTNPRNRLQAELSWLAGTPPRKAGAYAKLLRRDMSGVLRSSQSEPPLARANLIAAVLELLSPTTPSDLWAAWILELADLADEIDIGDLQGCVNEDRAQAGFAAVPSVEQFEEGLAARRMAYKQVVIEAMDRMPTEAMLELMGTLVERSTLGGTRYANTLIDDLVDGFSINASLFLAREAENVEYLLTRMKNSAAAGESQVLRHLPDLERVIANWGRVARPVQMNMRVRGIVHAPSVALSNRIREVCAELFKSHDMLDTAERATLMLRKLFVELPEMVESLKRDSDALKELKLRRATTFRRF